MNAARGLRRPETTGNRMIPAVMNPAPPMNASIGMLFAATYSETRSAARANRLLLGETTPFVAVPAPALTSPCTDLGLLFSTFLLLRDFYGGSGGGPLTRLR